jgi:phenylacetate-CoA ligase
MAWQKLRKQIFFTVWRLKGFKTGYYYQEFQSEDRKGIHPDTSKRRLAQILSHCEQSVPYYGKIMRDLGRSFEDDPFRYLRGFPILTKDIIRCRFDELKSNDLNHRSWSYATSGGSTGETVRIIADDEHCARASAVTDLFSKLIGKDVGESEIYLWASPRDLVKGTTGWKSYLSNKLSNSHFLDARQMTPEQMKDYIAILNVKRPKLIVAYGDALYEVARFAERERLEVVPQNAVITSAGMLFPFMRQKIEQIFHCRVFDRYGTREVGTIACERPGCEGLWVPPWTIYVEIADLNGNPVPNGTEGEILVTSLSNYAMPLIRYRIGDRGTLSSGVASERGPFGQVLGDVLGRINDTFKTRKGGIVHASYFAILLYFRDWIKQYQVIQKSYSNVVFRIVKSGSECPQRELNELTARTKMVMGEDCEVNFEFVDEISASNSGKFRYIMSEVPDREKKDG